MLRTATDFSDYKLRALDGDLGTVKEFYFDDSHWAIRYVVTDTGNWLFGRQVLITPNVIHPAILSGKVLPVELTKKQIEGSPSLTSHVPVSRQFEEEYFGYFGWPYYANGTHIVALVPTNIQSQETDAHKVLDDREIAWDPHLRSTHDVIGHHIQAIDAEIGHVKDFVLDDETWEIRYLVIDTKNWGHGKHVLISPRWIDRINSDENKVYVNLCSEEISLSPEYVPETLNRDYEKRLFGHYNRQGYWTEPPAQDLPVKIDEKVASLR